MRQSVRLLAVVALVGSGCARTYVARAEAVADPRFNVVPAVRERDGKPVALERGSFEVLEERTPSVAPGMVRVGGRGHRHPLAKAGIGVFVAGTILSVIGAKLTVSGLCFDSGCAGKGSGLFAAGVTLSAIGDAAFVVAGPVLWGVGAGLEPKEARYETSAASRTAPVLDVRF